MSLRILLIPVLILGFLMGGQPIVRAEAPCVAATGLCMCCAPAEPADRCCCAPDCAPERTPAPTPVRVEGPRIVLGLPPEVVSIPVASRVIHRAQRSPPPVRISGRAMLAMHCIWQT